MGFLKEEVDHQQPFLGLSRESKVVAVRGS